MIHRLALVISCEESSITHVTTLKIRVRVSVNNPRLDIGADGAGS